MHNNTFWKRKLNELIAWFSAWCKDNIDFAFVLAVFTETPRWTVTFMAIHEPLWIGVPLGVLLAFATSKVWKHYFRTRNGWLLLFNVVAMILAMLVITPVLYAMTEAHPHEVNVTTVFADWRTINPLRLSWAGGLALLTFVPLVQLAAVHGAQPDAKPAQRTTRASTPAAQPVPVIAQPVPTEDAQPDEPDARERAIMLHSEGLSYAQIASELGKHRNTIAAWLKHTNGHAQGVS